MSNSKRGHLSPICKIDTCGKKTLARGMCNIHYADWRRAHGAPLLKTAKDTEAMILEAMPATRRQIEAYTGLMSVTVLRYLPQLRAAKQVYVADHEPPHNGLGRWQPVYAIGKKPDKVLTEARKRQQAELRRAEKHAKGSPVVVHVPPSKWRKRNIKQQTVFSALGL